MGKKLYVGNLAYGVTDSDLQQCSRAFGTVQSAQVIMDRETNRSKGFGFVEMGSDAEAQAAITGLNGKDSGGRSLTVNEARPKEGGSAAVAAGTAAVAEAAVEAPEGAGMAVAVAAAAMGAVVTEEVAN